MSSKRAGYLNQSHASGLLPFVRPGAGIPGPALGSWCSRAHPVVISFTPISGTRSSRSAPVIAAGRSLLASGSTRRFRGTAANRVTLLIRRAPICAIRTAASSLRAADQSSRKPCGDHSRKESVLHECDPHLPARDKSRRRYSCSLQTSANEHTAWAA